MADIIQLKRNVSAPNKPASLAEGEPAYGSKGQNTDDEAAGGALYMGDGANVQTLISNTRQVELTGDQNVNGVKNFLGGLTMGPALTAINFPAAKGSAGQSMVMNAGSTALEFVTPGGVTVHSQTIGGTNGSPEANLNADATGLTVGPGQIWIVTDTESGIANIWTGGEGSFGTTSGGTAATAGMFTALGAAAQWATEAELIAGTVADKGISPAIAKLHLLHTDAAAGAQIVTVPTTTFQEKTAADGFGKVIFLSDLTMGAAGSGIAVSGPDATLGGTAANPMTIDNAIIDGGTY